MISVRGHRGRCHLTRMFWSVGWMLGCELLAAAPLFLGPSPYLGEGDRPYTTNGFLYYVMENLEDGAANLPGAFVSAGWLIIAPSPLTDSVDADDGQLDGSGIGGHSAFSSLTQSNLTVTFNPGVFGAAMPTHAAVVCTDIGAVLFGSFGVGDVTFTARDTNGVVLGSITITNFGNGSAAGNSPKAVSEDRFFGVIHPAGLSSVTLSVNNSVDWEVDHLQYGYLAVADAPPVLRIEPGSPGEVILAWATNAVGYELQEAFELPSTNWTSVGATPVVEGEEYQVVLTASDTNRFYRLSLPVSE